jgi:hypothetical protein
MSNINPNCDGSHCRQPGEVRLYPLGGGANLILCASCWYHENAFNRQRARETGAPENFPQRDWNTAKHYPEEQVQS